MSDADDWYTRPAIFDALGLTFDLDPCSPGPDHWVPARRIYTKQDDGLRQPWHGLVFMNPAGRRQERRRAMAQEVHRARQRCRHRARLHVICLVPQVRVQSRDRSVPARQDEIHPS